MVGGGSVGRMTCGAGAGGGGGGAACDGPCPGPEPGTSTGAVGCTTVGTEAGSSVGWMVVTWAAATPTNTTAAITPAKLAASRRHEFTGLDTRLHMHKVQTCRLQTCRLVLVAGP